MNLKDKNKMIIWKDVPVRICYKCWHIHKINGTVHRDFTKCYGDVPVAHFNEITKKMEPVVNNRGYGYAKRNDIKYRKRKV